uniref:Peroxin-13 n=1 Tax=Heterorhabditis bacteriophora TaxID=37862 RepID=A0A1I7WSP0_HETBA
MFPTAQFSIFSSFPQFPASQTQLQPDLSTAVQNIFREWGLQSQNIITTTVASERIEDIPNPDLEIGQFSVPKPESWPIGPDWNDIRNNWNEEKGWGGKDATPNNIMI